MSERDKFARLYSASRIWAVSSIHGEARRLGELHTRLAPLLQPGDSLVYLGNFMGVGPSVRDTLDELIAFRRWFLALPNNFLFNIAYLRGSQEEMWSKLLQLQFAPNPEDVLRWLLTHGVTPTLLAYGGDMQAGLNAAREGPVALTRWTSSLRDAVARSPGHTQLLSALRRAAFTDDRRLLLVNAGIDTARPLTAQSDSFWWASSAFGRIDRPFDGFDLVVRGYDPGANGVIERTHTISIDAGCGRGGPLVAVCLDQDRQICDGLQV